MATTAVTAAKKELRKEIAQILKSVSAQSMYEQSARITEKVLASHAFSSAKRVSIYVSADGEVNTSAIIERALHDNKVCFVPRFTPKAPDMEMVRLGSIDEFRSLPTIMWGIRQPPIDLQLENALDSGGLDLVLLPGVAFTVDGWRLGHGRGYYDRFLWEHKRRFGHFPTTIGLAFREQMRPNVPITDKDVRLDEMISG